MTSDTRPTSGGGGATLRIAGLRVGLHPRGDAELAPGDDLLAFATGAAGLDDLTVELGPAGDLPPLPRGERLFRADRVWDLHTDPRGPGWVLRWAPGGTGQLRIEAALSEDYARGEVRMDPWPGRLHLSGFPLVEVAFQSRLARRGGGVLVHALGLTLAGRGVLLPGSSGRGKSTLSGRFGLGEVLSDERVALVPGAGGPEVHGTPWRGTAGRMLAAGAPLRALVFLGPHTGPYGLRRLSPAEAFRRLAFHSFPPLWDRVGLEATLDLGSQVATTIPSYEVRFRPEDDVRALLGEALG